MTDDELIGFVPVGALIALAVRYEGLLIVLAAFIVLAVLVVALTAVHLWRRWRTSATGPIRH